MELKNGMNQEELLTIILYLFQRIEFDQAGCQLLLEHARNILIFER